LYSMLKGSAQYVTLTVALMAGAGAASVSKKYETIDTKIQFVRKPREPCVLPPEHREEKPIQIPKAAYVGLAALAVAALATVMRRKHDAYLENLQPRRWHAENFFGNDDFSER